VSYTKGSKVILNGISAVVGEVKPSPSEFLYKLPSDLIIPAYDTITYDTETLFYPYTKPPVDYTILVSKSIPNLSINIITPMFTLTSTIRLQLTNVSSRPVIINKESTLFVILDQAHTTTS